MVYFTWLRDLLINACLVAAMAVLSCTLWMRYMAPPLIADLCREQTISTDVAALTVGLGGDCGSDPCLIVDGRVVDDINLDEYWPGGAGSGMLVDFDQTEPCVIDPWHPMRSPCSPIYWARNLENHDSR